MQDTMAGKGLSDEQVGDQQTPNVDNIQMSVGNGDRLQVLRMHSLLNKQTQCPSRYSTRHCTRQGR